MYEPHLLTASLSHWLELRGAGVGGGWNQWHFGWGSATGTVKLLSYKGPQSAA